GLCGFGCRGRSNESPTFGIRLLETLISSCLRTTGIVVGLLGLAAFVDGALALTQQIENPAEVEVTPNLDPLLRRLRDRLQGFAEGICRGLIVFLVEKGFSHAEIRQRAVWLDAERALILRHSIVKAALLGQVFTSGNGGASAE